MADARTVGELITQGAQKFVQDYADAQRAVNQLTQSLQAQERVRTPQLAPAIAQINQALQQTRTSGAQFVQTLGGIQQATQRVTQVSNEKTRAIRGQSEAEGHAAKSGITYLSVLSAIHAASFLASNRTFTLLGSFVTLGLAFGKVSIAAGAVGLALGGLLVIFNAVNTTIELLRTIVLGAAQALGTFAAVAGAAVLAAGVAGTKIAADVETQLAGLRAFGGATAEQLKLASAQSSELAIRFGVSAKNVVEAASLFARAGGDVQEAIDGATEAVVKLQVASQGEIAAAQAAIAVSQGLRAFKLEGIEAARVADTLVGVAQASALSFTGVTQAFIQAAPGARTLGINIEDLGATMALLGNELVKGTITGTAFKQFLLDLINPSKKAQEEFNKYGISIETTDGKIRPLIDILGDLNKALGDQAVADGRVTEAERARALAIIFESRAALAANVLTREGAQGLDRFRDKLEQVTASNVVNVLMLPLNKQLEVLKVVVEEVGRAFGGPLLEPIRTATVGAINFLQRLIPAAELAGQVVSTVLTNQGFGQLQQKITELVGNNALSSFLIELTNSFRNVYDVIVNTIIPAIIDFGTRLGLVADESGRMDQVAGTFETINKAIQTTGAVVAALIRSFTELVVQIIHNEGRGRELRDTILNLATAIITQLVVGLATTGIALTIALAILNKTGQSIREFVLPNIAALGNALVTLASIADKIGDVLAFPFTHLARAAATAGAIVSGAGIEEAIERGAEASRAAEPIILKGFRAEIAVVQQLGKTLDALATKSASGFADIDEIIRRATTGVSAEAEAAVVAAEANATALRRVSDEATQAFDVMGTEAAHTQAQAAAEASLAADEALEHARVNARGFVDIFDRAGGQISDALANIIAEIAQGNREIDRSARGTVGAGSTGGIDEKEVQRASDRIKELAQDLARRLENLAEDLSTRTQNIVTKGLERIGDIYDKAAVDLQKLERDTNDRLNDIFENITQRRDDRGRTDALRDTLEDELRLEQGKLDNEERVEERTLDNIRLARQRNVEDEQRNLQEVVDTYERTYQRAQDAAERAFRNIQQTQEDALQRTQDAESKALQLSLDAQSNARREQQQLASAKTPEERKRVSQQIQDSRQQAAFDRGQQQQLDALKISQQQRQRTFQQQQETSALAFSQSQETKLLTFRKNSEKQLLATRRTEEDKERGIRETEEQAQFNARERREIKLRDLRRGHEIEIRNLQDLLEIEAAHRTARKTIRDALDRAGDIERAANTQAREVEQQAQQQLNEQLEQAEKTIRGVAQALDDLEESLPPDIFAAVFGQLSAKRAELAEISRLISEGFAGPEGLRESGLGELGREIGARELDLVSRAPSFTIPTLPVQVVPTQVINAGVVHVAQMTIGRLATTGIGQELFTALQRADQEGISLANLDLAPVTGALNVTNNGLDLLRRALGR